MAAIEGIDSVRKLFADQFEHDAGGIIYRKSQQGAAFRVTQEEHDRFVQQFDRAMSKGFWGFLALISLMAAGVIALATWRGSELSEPLLYAGMGALVLAYSWYVHWVWVAPTRALARRTPISGKRSVEEVRRLTFGRLGYGQLAMAGLGGLALPFLLSARNDPFTGWNRLWLVAGAGLVVLAIIQALRKWRFERDHKSAGAVTASLAGPSEPAEEGNSSIWRRLLPYLPAAFFIGGIGFIAYTEAGRRIARTPAFLPFVATALGCWALFTVLRGLQTGRIEPLVRGLASTYDRHGEPKRFWASLAWNVFVGLGALWIAHSVYGDAVAERSEDRCYGRSHVNSVEEALSACDALIAKHPQDADAYLMRGLIFLNRMRLDEAIRDFTTANELDPKSAWPIANRGISFAWKNDRMNAERDFKAALAIDPSNRVPARGEVVLDMLSGDLEEAIAGLDEQLQRDPKDGWALMMRADAHQQMGSFDLAKADRGRLSMLGQ